MPLVALKFDSPYIKSAKSTQLEHNVGLRDNITNTFLLWIWHGNMAILFSFFFNYYKITIDLQSKSEKIITEAS